MPPSQIVPRLADKGLYLASESSFYRVIKKLKAEVRRKDRVLAETTSLLVLSKKLEALYGEDPDSEDN